MKHDNYGQLLTVESESISNAILNASYQLKTEEDLRIRIEHILRDEILDKLGIPWAQYEHRTRKITSIGKAGKPSDALYGRVVIEYESPKAFGKAIGKKNSRYNHALSQITRDYIPELAKRNVHEYARYYGIVLDGTQIGFVRYRDKWIDEGPYPVNKNTIMKMLEAIRGLQRKPLDAIRLNQDLGIESEISKLFVKVLYDKLTESNTIFGTMLFNDWRRVFQQACGYSPRKLKGIEKKYGITKKTVNYESLLFAVHTYLALIMKLIGAEVAVLTGGSYLQSYIEKLRLLYYKGTYDFKDEFVKLEKGGVFKDLGIKNFLEGDYFAWYLDVWDKKIEKCVLELVDRLSTYEPGTVELEPESVRDLLKNLYQFLIPRKIRRSLGEYYTPDWLAEFTLDQTGYNGDIHKRLLDPSCGSGTFLVAAIKRAIRFSEDNFQDSAEVLRSILQNIVGFDLNPLAVIAARTNYLLALGGLRRYRTEYIEIPVYLSDSILVDEKPGYEGTNLVILHTTVGRFTIPRKLGELNMIDETLTIIDECLSLKINPEDFVLRLQKAIVIDDKSLEICKGLYTSFEILEREGRNGIWTKIIKNSFAPIFVGDFDFVVGNPPWVNWENLPESYRMLSKDLWKKYGLTKGSDGSGMGKTKKDLSMLFIAVSVDRYLSNKGKLSFVLPFTLFKSQAGSGIRTFLYEQTNVRQIDDMVELMPFEDSTNRTSILTLSKGKTFFPIPTKIWRKKFVHSFVDISLKSVMESVTTFDLAAEPLEGRSKPGSSWLMAKPLAFSAIRKGISLVLPKDVNVELKFGENTSLSYVGVEGVVTGLNAGYWVDVVSEGSNYLTIKNCVDASRYEDDEPRVEEVTQDIEKDLIFPLLRGRDVTRWKAKPSKFMIIPASHGQIIPVKEMQLNYPLAYAYFDKLFDYLVKRGGEPYYTKLAPYRDMIKKRNVAQSIAPPFYYLFNIKQIFSPYKVVWREIAGAISGKGVLIASVSSQVKFSGRLRTVIPDHKLMFIPCTTAEEAYFVCAVLNSTLIRLIVASYTIETAMGIHILKNLRIPKFSSANTLHLRIVSLSRSTHDASKKEIENIEKQIDEKISLLYALSDAEFQNVTDSLKILVPE